MYGRLKNLKISSKLVLAFAGVIAVMLAVSSITWSQVGFIKTSNGWTEHTYRVLALIDDVVASMVDQETGVRGFLVSGDETFLDPYTSGRKHYEESFSELKALTADNPQQQARLADLNRLAQTWSNDVAAKEVALMRDGATREQARAMETSKAGKQSMDGLRAKAKEIFDTENGLLAVRRTMQESAFSVTLMATWLGALIAVSVAAGMSLLLSRGLARPIRTITDVMSRLAEGDKSVDVVGIERGDEIGAMARAVEVFKRNAQENERLAAEHDREETAKEHRAQAVDTLLHDFESNVVQIIGSVTGAAQQLDGTAHTMTTIADEANRQATASAAAAEQTSANVQTVASASEEMAATLREISTQVSKSATIAAQAVQQADATNTTVRGLADAAQKIGEVVNLINNIASQTNLLALNATIEAARAGEAGKGFAVVASEVKGLANQTAKATEDISTQIASMQQATDGAVVAIQGIGETIKAIDEVTTAIAGAVEEQTAATGEIARNVQQAARGTAEVSSAIVRVTEAAGQTGESAEEVLNAAKDLTRQSDDLRHVVEGFLDGIRAA